MKSLQGIQTKLDAIRRSQELLANEEANLLAQLKQIRNIGDPPFCFLYETGDNQKFYCREFKSRSLTVAAARMARFMEKRAWKWFCPRVDYEAEFKGEYLDLYALGELHPLYEYLP